MRPNTMGWLFLVVALMIPAFLFYRWRSGMQGAQVAAVSIIAHERISSADPFGKSPQQTQFQNPLSLTNKPVAADPRGKMQAAINAVSAPESTAPIQAPTVAVAHPYNAATTQTPSLGGSAQTQESFASNEIEIARDPTLSPDDLAALQRIETERAHQEWLLHHPTAPKKTKSNKPVIESTIHLEGIVYAPGNSKAIVNDMTLGEGGRIGQIRIIRIGPSYVVFSYKNRTFVKRISK